MRALIVVLISFVAGIFVNPILPLWPMLVCAAIAGLLASGIDDDLKKFARVAELADAAVSKIAGKP